MAFWIFCTAMTLLVPLVMLIFGRVFLIRPPRDINGVYGYRTRRSMRNQETWAFAHRICGRLWFRLGLAMLPLSLCAMLSVLGRGEDAVGICCGVIEVAQLAVLIGSIFPVERALKRNFDDSGRKK